MSEEEKRTKKQKIEDNRRLRAMSQNSTMFSFTPSSSPPSVPEEDHFNFPSEYHKHIFLNNDDDDDDNKDHIHLFDDNNNDTNEETFNYKTLLNNDDCLILTKIEKDYTHAVRLNISVVRGHDIPCLRNLHDITDVVNEPAQMSTLRLITFLKLTPEFNVSLYKKEDLLKSCFFLSHYMKTIVLH
jgi:hypothetical protein